MKVVCYGDSNTYGYDPRSYLGGRYVRAVRWTERLADLGKWEIAELGLNGRQIPAEPTGDLLAELPGADILAVMLGSNDLIFHRFTAEDVAERMEAFLEKLPPLGKVLLVAPPHMAFGQRWVQEQRTIDESRRLGACYRALARKRGIAFADAADWDIELSYDGLHFSEEGHRRFAEGMERALDALA